MRQFALTCLSAAVGCILAGPASAGVKVSSVEQTYQIRGRTGAALLTQMDRRGPRHGLLTRAVAQTRYSIYWDLVWVRQNGACRVRSADGVLSITYIYPQVASPLPRSLQQRWRRFMAGVREHERKHGQIAVQMARAAERSAKMVAFNRDPSCRRSRAEVNRRIGAVYARYEQQQADFDTVEHRENGPVEKLINSLISGR